MPDITIQINTPTLVSGESFKTRYRQLPAGAWSSYTTRTNAPFTLTGLSVGDYELEVIVVKGATECPAIIRPFKVVQPFSCITFDAEIVQNDIAFNLVINYTIPGGFTNPPCGWKVIVTGNTTNKTIPFVTLPTPPLKIAVANEGLFVKIVADLCNGKTQNCYEGDVPPISIPCVPIVLGTVTATFIKQQPNGKMQFRIRYNFTQSSPATTSFVLGVVHINGPNAPAINYPSTAPYGPVSPSASFIDVYIDADFMESKIYKFEWFIMDRCLQQFANVPGTPIVVILP
jgi:hypothetical protein